MLIQLICAAGIETPPPVMVLAADTDVLVILVATTPSNQKVHFGTTRFSWNQKVHFGITRFSCVDIGDIQARIGDLQQHLLFCRAFSGCDSVSALFGKGKKTVNRKIANDLATWLISVKLLAAKKR